MKAREQPIKGKVAQLISILAVQAVSLLQTVN